MCNGRGILGEEGLVGDGVSGYRNVGSHRIALNGALVVLLMNERLVSESA